MASEVYALGPNHGPLLYRLVAIPRSFAGQISAMVPPALLSGDAPQTPARNRKRMRTMGFGASAQGIWKRKKGMKDDKKIGRCRRIECGEIDKERESARVHKSEMSGQYMCRMCRTRNERTSLSGANIRGLRGDCQSSAYIPRYTYPTANPITYSDIGSIATVTVMFSSRLARASAPVYADDPNVTQSVPNAT